ncbi:MULTISPECIES: 2OG-Fe dioxygenase family protein [Actinosynnema]|uniref:2OG-Fe dioxygenase family protein n=1 Tax=Actinosynnema TaxID=40566 RepID=UPI0020A5DC85|nr:2OG-Fe dioxygenase family protein [Actinosynnema pretiosum]MCP2097817.1 hypothetical protein [Actinosynnema pretiosum]
MKQLIGTSTELSRNGFARYDLGESFQLSDEDANLQALRVECEDLPIDPYAPAAGRRRRYGRGVLLPWQREFSWLPPVPVQDGRSYRNSYYQGGHNPEYVGVSRDLMPLTEGIRDNALLRRVIMFDFDQTWWTPEDSTWPLHVGVHVIKLSVDQAGALAVSSPPTLHQDGEPFTFAHLLVRRNAEGGTNVIASPGCRGMDPANVPAELILSRFELTRPLESYGVADEMVSHYVGPVGKGPGVEPGERVVLLVDFTPMRRRV